jgi:1-deoxy-D-xylulose-5-phosphate synthase
VLELAASNDLLVTLEDNSVAGGAGAAVSELLQREGQRTQVLNLGLPDSFVEHGKREEQLAWVGLDAEGVAAAIHKRLTLLNAGQVPLEVSGAPTV